MARQEGSVQELGFLHDDLAAGANDARELAECLARLLDMVEHVAAPDPVEARVGRIELRGVSRPELEPRAGGPATDQPARRIGAFGRRLDAHHAPARADRLGQPDGEEPGAAANVEAARAVGQAQIGDQRARLRLLEEVHALQRLPEGLGRGRGHDVLAAASASSAYLPSVRWARAAGQRPSSTIRKTPSRTRAKCVSWPPSSAAGKITSYAFGPAGATARPGSSPCHPATVSRSAWVTSAAARDSTNTLRR